MKIISIISFITLFSVNVFAQNILEEVKANIIGIWSWNKTEVVHRGGSGKILPSECNCTRRIEIMSDGRYMDYRNDTLYISSTYEISQYNFMDDPARFSFHSQTLNGQIILNNNELSIGDFGNCGEENYFIKAIKSSNKTPTCSTEGKIISFNSLKCLGCWGWLIAVGNDTIKTDDLPKVDLTQISIYPISVDLTLGELQNKLTSDFPYYVIDCIDLKEQ